jgi:uncharacterized DUF497 family protein/uncharacterized protein (DUF4415 family)
MKFVWDEMKDLANRKKHKVSFAQAIHSFYDPLKKEYYDGRHSSLEEDRSIVVGFAINAVLIASFTERILKRSVLFPPERRRNMNWRHSIMGIVSYTIDTLPSVSKEDLDMVAALKDEEIDCSDISEIKDLSCLRSRPGHKMNESTKVAVICNLDSDIAAWLKQDGEGYQIRVNSILRQAMAHSL